MAKPPPTFASLEGLLEHGQRDGFDIRPTLLRVLTDLYLQKPAHPGDDERYYTELALRLIGSTDATARAAVAERLASYPAAPRAVILHLARDVIDVAGPILRHSPCLSAADLQLIKAECGAGHAAIIATRLPEEIPAPGPNAAPAIPTADRANPEAAELTEIFFAAGAAERREILLNLDYTSPAPLGVAPERASEVVARLERAALAHNVDAFTREIELAFGLAPALARRIVVDELGEPIVVAAKALRAPRAVVERILLFVNPRIGQSVARVYELATRYDEISTQAALRLIAIWQEAGPREDARPRPEQVARRPLPEGLRMLGARRRPPPREARVPVQSAMLLKR
jgi:hypothetical protein